MHRPWVFIWRTLSDTTDVHVPLEPVVGTFDLGLHVLNPKTSEHLGNREKTHARGYLIINHAYRPKHQHCASSSIVRTFSAILI